MTTMLENRLKITHHEDEGSAWWVIEYKPTTIAFDPVIIMEFPSVSFYEMPWDFVAHLAKMVAAVDCDLTQGRTAKEISEEVVRMVYAKFDRASPGNSIERAFEAIAAL